MKVLILCGYRKFGNQTREIATRLDHSINEFHRLGHKVIVALAGLEAEEILLRSRHLQDVELVFDTNEPANLWTNVKSGLAAIASDACLLHPIEVSLPVPAHIRSLMKAWFLQHSGSQPHFIQLTDRDGALLEFGFPLLISNKGVGEVKKLLDSKGLNDPRLSYLQVPHRTDSDLAPMA